MNILLEKILNIFINDLLKQTKKSVTNGNKVFGAFILNKINYDLICIGTNNEIENPLYHGEISTIFNFFKLKNIDPKQCYFVSSHEPCSLCLSAITWSGFDNFFYLFPYNDTNLKFKIPHDLKILEEVFSVKKGLYNKKNLYWNSYNIVDEIKKIKNINHKNKFQIKLKEIQKSYSSLSKIYQETKETSKIPLN